jgi:hypothetical protein
MNSSLTLAAKFLLFLRLQLGVDFGSLGRLVAMPGRLSTRVSIVPC